MDWLDRTAELARLDRFAERPGGGLAVIWGRRRVGKTRLLVEWARRHGGVYFVADESAPPQQRRRLADALAVILPGFAEVEYPDWSSLLSRLANDALATKVTVPIVIDELPYLVVASPDLPATLQRFVDHEAKRAGLVLAVAGSSQRMMQGLVLDADAPLYGRAAEAFELRPLTPDWLRPALGLRKAIDVVKAWNVWGGLPRYWELARGHSDRRAAVDALVLDPMGPLHNEPPRLLLEELPSATTLRPVLDAIGAGAHRLSEIGGRIGSPATSLSRPMVRLLELGLVTREIPFGEPERATKRALYRLADPFLRLWFNLVAPKRAQLAHLPPQKRLALLDERMPHLDAASWEELCRLAVPRLDAVFGESFGVARRFWSGAGPEWDLVALGGGGKHLVAEVKWSTATATAADLAHAYGQLLKKGQPPHVRGDVVHALFVPVLPRQRPKTLPKDLLLIDADAVLAAFSE